MQNYRSDFPVLMVEGYTEFKFKSVAGPLSEAGCDTNFNPTGAPAGAPPTRTRAMSIPMRFVDSSISKRAPSFRKRPA